MDEKISGRLGALTPEQRALLEARVKKRRSTVEPAAKAAWRQAEATASHLEKNSVAYRRTAGPRNLKFSLYFFSDDGCSSESDKYKLLLEGAKFADNNGFCAVWTPERHFQGFGGLYPNPSVVSAALAALTSRVQIRAGSVALPLHHPVRVAEEWSVVDNLSHGRVAVSFASGWHPDDFIFAPAAYENRKELMLEYIEKIQKLWAGEEVVFNGAGNNSVPVRILPRPVQSSLPIWITTAGNPATWTRAGQIGANVFCALVGYSFDDLAERISEYRKSRQEYGHDPDTGQVTVMLHTYIGDDEKVVKQVVRQPMCSYLRSYFQQFQGLVQGSDQITEEDKMAIVARAFDSYYDESLLIGTSGKCERLADRLQDAGVDELACLVDFGLSFDLVMEGLNRLAELRTQFDHADNSAVLAAAPVEGD